ncbi:MAG TPA: AarF/ABC1/UbiB kinase family protein [Polyangiaceae bacterium]|nr:AarF/ABC1/UbiB kinase family protein [Polyangiaceae bacterium]
MSRDGYVPEGRFGRFARFAMMGGAVATRRLFTRDPAKAAEQMAEVLGNLRGLAAKVGQMASYVDGFVPESQAETFQAVLHQLQAQAPRSPAGAVRAQLERELGAPVERLFSAFSDEPFASASIGQVHEAYLPDGRRVAVKVQHPGIDKAVEADLANGRSLADFAAAVLPATVDPGRLYDELSRRFKDELDYTREAAAQDRFMYLHEGDPEIWIPQVIRERSSRRVLTTELAEGEPLEAVRTWPAQERARIARILWRFAYKSILVGSVFNADPHPGNYLFVRGGPVIFLDFGCIEELTPHVMRWARAAHRAALSQNETIFARNAARLVGAQGGPWEAAFVAYLRKCVQPLFYSPFHVTRDFAKELVTGLYDLRQYALDKGSGFSPVPESTLLLNRLHVGFFSVLARLDAVADYAAEERKFLTRLEDVEPPTFA